MNEQFLAGLEDYMDFDDFRKAELAEKIKARERLTSSERSEICMYLTGTATEVRGRGGVSKIDRNKKITFKFIQEYLKNPKDSTAIKTRLFEAEKPEGNNSKYSPNNFKAILNRGIAALTKEMTGLIDIWSESTNEDNSRKILAAKYMLDGIEAYQNETAKFNGVSRRGSK